MLDNFFRINMPYGLKRKGKDEWVAFNREYMPLGWNSTALRGRLEEFEIPIYTRYKGLTDRVLRKLGYSELSSTGQIERVFLYNDGTNPTNNPRKENWDQYFEKLKLLSRLRSL